MCHLYPPDIQAQPAVKDSLSGNSGYGDALRLYHDWLAPEPNLYRGPEYVAYDHLLREGHPYYGDNSRYKGAVWYNGIFYDNLLLQYDLVKDQLVINDPTYNIFRIGLITTLIDSFSLGTHFFLHLADDRNPTAPRNGFYERLYNGRIVLLKREKKVIEKDLYSSDHVEQFIRDTDSSYYLQIGNLYRSVNNIRSLLDVLKDRKKEVRKFIRSSHLSMRKDRENTLIKVTAWYDSSAH